MQTFLYILIQLMTFILIAPLVNGIINRVKAITQKRRGAPLLQMYYDLFKLLKKNSVVSETSSWIFKAAPYILFVSSVTAAMLVPITTKVLPSVLPGDVIMLVSLLALGRFFMALSGLDTGSTFGGMGSSREAMISSIMEPAMLVSVFTISLIAHSTSVANIMKVMQGIGSPMQHPVFAMTFIAMMIVLIAETSRIPVDDPATHLELTMVHEAMILEYSGRHLALMELGAAVKQMIFITLLVNIFLPHDQLILATGFVAVLLSVLIFIIKVILVSILIALCEVSTVKLRIFSIPNLAALSFILSFLGFLQYFVLGR